jgi:hypothetical protein
VACERLVIGSLELEPYEYAEDVLADDNALRVVARALVADEELSILAQLSGAIEVIRVGVSDQPRWMTIDYVWGERPEGLAVAVRCIDVREPRVTLDRATIDEDVLAQLIQVLSSRGVVDDADLEQLRQRRHAARRVANIDGWDLMK